MAPIANLTVRISAQIAELQKGFAEAKTSVEKFQQGVSNAGRTLATTFGVAFGSAAIVGFARNVVNAAGDIVDLSNKLGISTEAVQKFQYIANQTGTTVDAFGKAVFLLGTNLTSGDKSTVAAVEKLGFSLSEIQKLNPEQKFDAVVSALSRMGSETERNTLLVQIFGARQAQELAKMVAEYEKLAKEAPIAGDAQVKALEKAGDAAERAKSKIMAMATQGLGGLIIGLETAEPKVFKLADTINTWLQGQPGVLGYIARHNEGLHQQAAAADAAAGALARLKAQTPTLATQPALGPAGDFNAGLAISGSFKSLASQDKALEKVRDLIRETYEETARLQAIEKRYNEVVAETNTLLDDSRRRFNDLNTSLHDGAVAWLAQQQSIGPVAELLNTVGGNVSALIPKLSNTTLETIETGTEVREFTVDLTALSQSLANLGQAGGPFGEVAQRLATLVTGIDAVQKSIATMKTGFEAFSAGGVKNILSGITSLASGILGITSAAIAAGRAITSAFDRDKGRDLVEDFAKGFGGFDALQKELERLGLASSGLWEKLTQGVGRNNPEQAQRVIAEVEEAMRKAREATEAIQVTGESGAQATIETTAQAVTALNELNEKITENVEVWGAWSEDVTGFLQRVADGIRAIPSLPTPSGGGVVSPTSGGVSGGVTQTISVSVGSDVIASAAVQGMPSALEINGVA